MQTLSLSVYDRLTLMGVLPAQVGSFDEMLVVNRLRKELDLNDDEKKASNFSVNELGSAQWLPNTVDDADFDFTDEQAELIGKGLALLEMRGQIPTDPNFISFYEKFSALIPSTDAAPDATSDRTD